MPQGLNLIREDEPWEVTCQRLTLGHLNNDGTWVPGQEENIRDLKAHWFEVLWLGRLIAALVALRFLGLNTVMQLAPILKAISVVLPLLHFPWVL